jgi:chemotaxis protein MotB
MSASGGRGGRKRRGGPAEDHPDERWLLTYADMITLLMALFMVMFSISSVNKAKFETLQRTLKEAFSAKLLPGGEAIRPMGASAQEAKPSPSEPAVSAIAPTTQAAGQTAGEASKAAQAAARESEDFQRLKREIDAYAATHGLAGKLSTEVSERGLVIRLLTDKLLFDSGGAVVRPPGESLLDKLARLLRAEVRHPIVVEGHTDSVPLRGGSYPTNWELSTARASSVVRTFLNKNVNPRRLSATGYSHLRPLTTNATPAGRARNRRVEIVLIRTGKPSTS